MKASFLWYQHERKSFSFGPWPGSKKCNSLPWGINCAVKCEFKSFSCLKETNFSLFFVSTVKGEAIRCRHCVAAYSTFQSQDASHSALNAAIAISIANCLQSPLAINSGSSSPRDLLFSIILGDIEDRLTDRRRPTILVSHPTSCTSFLIFISRGIRTGSFTIIF